MRIVVDALAARTGGTAYAAAWLSRALADHESVELVCVLTRDKSIVATELQVDDALHVELLPAATRAELPRRVCWEATMLPGLLCDQDATHLLSWSGMLPRALGVPVLCHISNSLMFESPRPLDVVRMWAMARTARFGARFATPTHAMAELATDTLGRTPTVIPYGVDAERFFPADRVGHEIICVADFYPHKRHDLILDAWAGLESPRPPLRLVGDASVNVGWHQKISRQAAGFKRFGRIRIDAKLDSAQIGAAYREARVMALASEHESFCLPLLEAQACGLATVARDLPALQETGGPSTVFVTGDRADDWTLAIQRALSSFDGEIDDTAVAHAALHTWEESARFAYETLAGLR